MKFKKVVSVKASLAEVWALLDDLETVAHCIPGLGEYSEVNAQEFDSVLVHRVGPVKARFELKTRIVDIEHEKSLTLVSEGRESHLDSWVKANLDFTLAPNGDSIDIDISAEFSVTGRVGTFGQRIISTKAEQVVLQAMRNIDEVLERRRSNQ